MSNIGVTLTADDKELLRVLKALEGRLDGLEGAARSSMAGATAAANQASQAIGNLERQTGMTAKGMSAALRTVPAQFTDIVTSLQAGQPALQVLLQQGGQLKDTFGGVMPAFRALGGYIVGLINPFTAAAAAAGLLAYGFYKGSEEGERFARTLILTGNAAGLTVDGLMDAAAAVKAIGAGTQGRAAEVLSQIAASGQVGTDSLVRFTAAALQLERVGGPAAEDTAKAFAELGKDPLKASIKLNESTNYLTQSVYAQLKALSEQGRHTDAARVAQDAYAAALEQRAPAILDRLGSIERLWMGIKNQAKQAADFIASIGREETASERIAYLQRQLEINKQKRIGHFNQYGSKRPTENQQLQAELSGLQQGQSYEAMNAYYEAERAASVKATVEADKEAAKAADALAAAAKRKADEMAAAAKREAEARAAVIARLMGLNADYAEQLARLNAMLADGVLKEDAYTLAVQRLVAAQPFAEAAARERAKAEKEMQATLAKTASMQAAEAEKYAADADAVMKSNEQLRGEIKLIGQGEAARSALAMVKEREIVAGKEMLLVSMQNAGADANTIGNLEREIALRRQRLDLLAAQGGALDGVASREAATKTLEGFNDFTGGLDKSRLDGLFSGALSGADKFISALTLIGEMQQRVADATAANLVRNGAETAAYAQQQQAINKQAEAATLKSYGSMAGAAKGYFKEGSRGYKALGAAEKVFHAFELALAVQSAATKLGLIGGVVAAKVAGDQAVAASAVASAATESAAAMAKGSANALAGVANQANGDPYTAFPRMAAMAALMAALGFATGAVGGGRSAPRITNEGKGTVLGSPDAQSESLSKSLELLTGQNDIGLRHTASMARSLRNIENSIGNFTALLFRTGGLEAVQSGLQLGRGDTGLSNFINDIYTTQLLGPIGKMFEKVTKFLFGQKTTLIGTGITGGAQSLGSVMDDGFQGSYYADTNTKKKFLGVTYSSKNRSKLNPLDEQTARQIGLIFSGIGESLSSASESLGMDVEAINRRISGYVIELGKIDLKGLDAEAAAKKINAVFSAQADLIAAFAVPGLEELQRAGEGYFETLGRVALQVEASNVYMGRLNRSLRFTGTAGAMAADQLVRAFGGLEEMAAAASAYYEAFYTEADRVSGSTRELTEALAELGMGMPESMLAYRAMVTQASTDTSEAGLTLTAGLIKLAPAFAEVESITRKLAEDTAQRLIAAFSGSTGAVAALDSARLSTALLSTGLSDARLQMVATTGKTGELAGGLAEARIATAVLSTGMSTLSVQELLASAGAGTLSGSLSDTQVRALALATGLTEAQVRAGALTAGAAGLAAGLDGTRLTAVALQTGMSTLGVQQLLTAAASGNLGTSLTDTQVRALSLATGLTEAQVRAGALESGAAGLSVGLDATRLATAALNTGMSALSVRQLLVEASSGTLTASLTETQVRALALATGLTEAQVRAGALTAGAGSLAAGLDETRLTTAALQTGMTTLSVQQLLASASAGTLGGSLTDTQVRALALATGLTEAQVRAGALTAGAAGLSAGLDGTRLTAVALQTGMSTLGVQQLLTAAASGNLGTALTETQVRALSLATGLTEAQVRAGALTTGALGMAGQLEAARVATAALQTGMSALSVQELLANASAGKLTVGLTDTEVRALALATGLTEAQVRAGALTAGAAGLAAGLDGTRLTAVALQTGMSTLGVQQLLTAAASGSLGTSLTDTQVRALSLATGLTEAQVRAGALTNGAMSMAAQLALAAAQALGFAGPIGTINRLLGDASSGTLTFGDRISTTTAALTPAQLAVAALQGEIFTLRSAAGGTVVDITGLSAALKEFDTKTFVATIVGVFELIGARIKDTLSSIADERVAVRDAAIAILKPGDMSPAQIRAGITASMVGMPSNAGVAGAQQSLASADAYLASVKTMSDARVAMKRADLASREASAAALPDFYKGKYNEFVALQKQYGNVFANQAANEGKARSAYQYNEETNRLNGYGFDYSTWGNKGWSDLNGFHSDPRTSQLRNELDGGNWQLQRSEELVRSAKDILAGTIAAAAADVSAATVRQTSAVKAAQQAQLDYVAALQKYSMDASRAVTQLGRLREETVRYYESQQQLATLMTGAASTLRSTVAAFRFDQLDPAAQLASLQERYNVAYSMALSTTGEALAGYGQELNGLINPLLQKAQQAGLTGAQYSGLVNTVLARAEATANRLDEFAPKDYQAESLGLLGQIDSTLAALEKGSLTADQLIVQAIDAGKDTTRDGLRAVLAALTGKAVPAFATGGMHTGGLRIVGENGPELEATGPARIYSAAETSRMLRGPGQGGDNSELVAELQALRAEVGAMRREQQALQTQTMVNTGKTLRLLDRFEGEGMPVRNAEGEPLVTEAA